MDSFHWCVFLAFIFSLGCSAVQQNDGLTYVSTTGNDNVSCFNAGIDNPCKSFTYVLLNAPISCGDNCVIIILDSQPQIISITNNVVFRKNQSLHLSTFNVQMLNVSFGNIQISSRGFSNITFENLVLVFGRISFSLLKRVEFRNVVIKHSFYSNLEVLYFLNVKTIIIQNARFQKFSSECANQWLRSKNVSTAVFTNCSFVGNKCKFTSVLDIRASKFVIEHCTFESNYVILALLNIELFQGIDYNITTCVFINNTAMNLIRIVGSLAFNSPFFVNISSNIFHNNAVNKHQDSLYSALIAVFVASKKKTFLQIFTNNSITNNKGPAFAFVNSDGVSSEISNTLISSNIANSSIIFIKNSHLSNITFANTSIVNNSIPALLDETTNEQDAVVYIKGGIIQTKNWGVVQLKNVVFMRNTATPLALIDAHGHFVANNVFQNNVAMYGGGIYFDGKATVTFYLHSKVEFVNNTARYGGAIYISKDNKCIIDALPTISFNLIFSGNSARTGPSANIYSYQSWCDCHSYHTPFITWDTDPLIISYPTNINISNKILEIYPGKIIKLNYSVFDCNGTDSTCVADAFLGCGDKLVCTSKNVHLAGPPTVFLSSDVIDTGLVIRSSYQSINQKTIKESTKLYFRCRDPPAGMIGPNANIKIHLIDCPLGLVYDTDIKQCRCAVNNSDTFLCSVQQGQVCIRKGYWYTRNMDKPIVKYCPFHSNCKFNRKACPTDIQYIILPQIEDDQCHDGHGGTLCMNCTENNIFTYLSLKCIDYRLCKSWHPYMLLMLTMTFPLLIGIFLILVVKMRSKIGSGYLYGPLFFLAVLSQLPLGQYPTLDKIVSVFAASVLLQFKAFGFIPWCFFPSMNPLYNTFLQFLNPIMMVVVLLTTVFIARRCPRKFLTLQHSPMQAMCILILVSYWSLIRTSILILTPFYFNGNIVVLLQPDLLYLHKAHIPLWIISLLIMISLCVLVFLIAFSQCFNFHRMKPLLDELQSCYQDKYRWYGVVYVCTWITIQGALYKYIAFQTVILGVTLAHCLVQPYKKKWLNICDTCLLFDLVFLTALLSDENKTTSDTGIITEVMIYLLVMIPFCFISVGGIGIITVRTGLFSSVKRLYNCWKDKCTGQQNNIQQSPPPQVIDSFIINDCEREPLIHILQAN